MFSKACLASQQLRNTGMKRFLKEGKITCQEEKASVCLAECLVTFFKNIFYTITGSLTRKEACVSRCLLWYPFCITVLNMFKKGGWDCKCSVSLHDNYLQKSAVLTFSYHVSKGILQEINTFPWWFLGVILNNTAFNHIVYKWKRNGYMKDILRETIKHTAEMLRADFTFVHFVF